MAMPKTPGQSDLPFTEDELRGIRDLLPKSISIVIKHTPAKQDILGLLHRVQIVHLACHGQSVYDDPSQSFLLLKDWQTDPLTVGDIFSLNLRNCRLAYLSACHAANNSSEGLFNEAIHIAGACQLAGIPHVIATLWHIRDRHSANVAKDFIQD